MFSIVAEMECPFVNVGDLIKYKTMPPTDSVENCSGWPHSNQNEIPCVFPEFSLCYKNFPCVIFT